MPRIYLSPPELAGNELELLRDALTSNWIAPLGPHVDAFEAEMAAKIGMPHAVATSSGTAALHLALEVAGVGRGDDVWVSTLTFVASASPITYLGARPVFVDSDPTTWMMDTALVADELARAARAGRLPKAIVTVDLYGQMTDPAPITELCREHGVILIEDAAEALGATCRGQPAGSLADLSILSFNGNKIITTSGGGMLLSRRADWANRARFLATQAREPVRHYEHIVVGYNYRLSNLLAAVGRAQLADLDRRVDARRAINARYRERLAHLPGWRFMDEGPEQRGSFWLTTATIDADAFGASRDAVIDALAAVEIEARPLWKPLHLQPAFATSTTFGGRTAERLFADGLCLPSGTALTPDQQAMICATILELSWCCRFG